MAKINKWPAMCGHFPATLLPGDVMYGHEDGSGNWIMYDYLFTVTGLREAGQRESIVIDGHEDDGVAGFMIINRDRKVIIGATRCA